MHRLLTGGAPFADFPFARHTRLVMKILTHLALVTLLACTQAQANTWTMPNEAGGHIVLTNRPCPEKSRSMMLESYAYSASGKRQDACWTFFDDLIQIYWTAGQRSTHAQEDFTPSASNAPTRPVAPRAPARQPSSTSRDL